jgi:DnaJ family protein C protein 8
LARAEVKKAYNLITQEDRRKVCVRTIENATRAVEKERRLKIKKGAKESELGDLEEAVEKAVLRAFAEIENRRVNIEKREAAQRRREAEQEEQEQKEVSNMFKRERTWAETDRREQRVGSWRSFVKGGKRRKELDAHGWKEETRVRGILVYALCLLPSDEFLSSLVLTGREEVRRGRQRDVQERVEII